MELKLSHTILATSDHDAALTFYRDVLGFTVVNDVAFEGMRWLTVSPPSQPELEIVLETPGACASAEDRQTIENLLAKGVLGRINFTTDDVDKAFDQIQASGAEVVQEPMDQPYGVRDCAFRDPSGNLLRFNQAKR
jgi:catechol 2,3-dioxygenase-like lactoylglutathione lyase family enzyme